MREMIRNIRYMELQKTMNLPIANSNDDCVVFLLLVSSLFVFIPSSETLESVIELESFSLVDDEEGA